MRWGPCSGMGGGLFLSQRYLDEYIAAAGIAEDPDAPLFQTAAGRNGPAHRQRSVAAGRLPHDPTAGEGRRASRPGSGTIPSAPPASPPT